jgi:DeoR/GlpR family transcriptional regulator of sugar metabolism
MTIDDYKKEMADRSEENICLVDSTKFHKIAPKRYYSVNDVSRIVTDSGIDDEIIDEFKEINKEIIVAE